MIVHILDNIQLLNYKNNLYYIYIFFLYFDFNIYYYTKVN